MKVKDYPKSLIVKDASYSVKFVRKFPPRAGAGSLDGYCCYESQTIYLRLGQKKTERLSTAIHEVLHALDVEWDIGLTHPQIYRLEEALLRLLGDNGI